MTKEMISASERYFSALKQLDKSSYIKCFSSEAELHDPYGGKPFHGQDGLARWFVGMERTWTEFSIEANSHYISGDRIAVQWHATGKTGAGKTADFAGINVFTINQAGLITRLEGYWDARSMMAQIS